MLNIIIVDDDSLVSLSLKTILEASKEVTVLGMGSDGSVAIDLYDAHKPDVLLMDIRMEPMSGLEAGEKILMKHPEAKILYLTTFSDDEYIIKALHIGAKGYLLKQNFESILPSLKAVQMGQSVFGNEIITKIPTLIKSEEKPSDLAYELSKKEKELIELVAQGLNNKEISEALYLSEGTIRNYLSNLLEKLNLRDRTQLAIFYYQHKN